MGLFILQYTISRELARLVFFLLTRKPHQVENMHVIHLSLRSMWYIYLVPGLSCSRQTMDSIIHQINLYPVDSPIMVVSPKVILDSDLSGG